VLFTSSAAAAADAGAALRFMKLVKVYFCPARIVLPAATSTTRNLLTAAKLLVV